MEKIDVALGQDSYTIEIARGLWKDVGTKIRSLSKAEKVAVITDDTVDALYGKALEENFPRKALWFAGLFSLMGSTIRLLRSLKPWSGPVPSLE